MTSQSPGFCPTCGRPAPSAEGECVCGHRFDGAASGELWKRNGRSLTQSPDTTRQVRWPRIRPWMTYCLIGLNVAMFLLMTLAAGSARVETLLEFGAMYRPLLAAGEYWRVVTPIFLHIGFMHLLFNMYALLVLGNVVEQLYDPFRYFLLYLISGVVGVLASARFSTAVSAGASGAIFGLAGIALVAGLRHRDRVPGDFKRAVGRGIVPFVIFNLAYGFSNKGIDNFAHLGGLLSGILLALWMAPVTQSTADRRSQVFSPVLLLPLAVVLGAFFFPLRAHFEMQKVEADFKLALQLEKQNRLDESIAAYQRALRRRPDLPSIHNNLAVLLMRQKRFGDAEREARRAVRFGEKESMYHQTLGVVLWNESKLEEAAAQYRRAIELDPRNAELYEALADIDEEQGKIEDALSEWTRVQSLRPHDPLVAEKIATLRQLVARQSPGK